MSKENFEKTYKIGILISALGLILLLAVIALDAKYPSAAFRILTGAGLGFLSLGIVVSGVSWILTIIKALKERDWGAAKSIFIKGLIIIAIPVIKLLAAK